MAYVIAPKPKPQTDQAGSESEEQLRNQGQPSDPTRRAINLQAVQKLRICETAMATICLILMGMLIEPLACPATALVSYSQHLRAPPPNGPPGESKRVSGPVDF